MATTHFKIDAFRFNKFAKSEWIQVDVQNNEETAEIEVTIPRDKFELWLRTDGNLDWVIDGVDHEGEHTQAEGTMTLEEYWDSDIKSIYNDFYNYICSHPITFRGQVRPGAVTSLLTEFAKKS